MNHAPGVDEKMLLMEQAMEDLEHFEGIAALYADLGAGDLFSAVAKRASDLPPPRSWAELCLAQLLIARAAAVQLSAHRASTYAPFTDIVARLLATEEKHAAAAEAALRAVCATRDVAAEAQSALERWLHVALLSFGRPRTAGGAKAIALGLKARDSAELSRDFLAGLTPLFEACGLIMPARQALGLDLPEGLLAAG
jgi:1,2-phenylacetyl-CoA epoxidase catalytic subunit